MVEYGPEKNFRSIPKAYLHSKTQQGRLTLFQELEPGLLVMDDILLGNGEAGTACQAGRNHTAAALGRVRYTGFLRCPRKRNEKKYDLII